MLTRHQSSQHPPDGTPRQTPPVASDPPMDGSSSYHTVPVFLVALSQHVNSNQAICDKTNLSTEQCWLYSDKHTIRISKPTKSRSSDVPKSRFSRMRIISAPCTLSSASGFSLTGFQRSVPGIRPYHRGSIDASYTDMWHKTYENRHTRLR